MKFFKKFAAVLIVMAVFTVGNIGILPKDGVEDFMLSVRAADSDIVASGECGAEGDNLTWTLDSEGTLIISGEGEMANWVQYSEVSPWYFFNDIVNIIIENGVTNIGARAFYYCDALTSITIPDSVTSIGAWAFDDCESLTSITIPDSVTSIGNGAFYNCDSLNDVWYSGTEEEWNSIIIRINNYRLYDSDVTIHYNSVTIQSPREFNNIESKKGEREKS